MAHPIPGPTPSPSYTTITSPIAVVGRQYCISQYPIDLVIKRKTWTLNHDNMTVNDINKNIIFKLKAKTWSLHNRRILHHPNGNSIVTLQEKTSSMHGRWNVFNGESNEKKDLLFTAKSTSIWHELKTNIKMDVFLANNTKQETPDFKMEGSSSKMDGIIYAGDGQFKTILAQCELREKDAFSVKIYPNVDYAFIVALIVILLHTIDNGAELQQLLEVLMAI